MRTPQIQRTDPIDDVLDVSPLAAKPRETNEALERTIWKPSNGPAKDSAENLKKVITGKSYDKKRGAVSQHVALPYKKASVDLRAHRMDHTPSPGVQRQPAPTHTETTRVPLPPQPSAHPKSKPREQHITDSPESRMIRALRNLLQASSDMQPPVFKFEATAEAASHNFDLLQKNISNWRNYSTTPRTALLHTGRSLKV